MCTSGLMTLFLAETDKHVSIEGLSCYSPRIWCWWVNSLMVKWSCVILESHATSVKAQTSGIYLVLLIMLVSCSVCLSKYLCNTFLNKWISFEVLLFCWMLCYILQCYRSKQMQHGCASNFRNCHIIMKFSTCTHAHTHMHMRAQCFRNRMLPCKSSSS